MGTSELQPLLNDTRWRELRLAMLELEHPPQWVSTAIGGYRYGPDREWFYHFQQRGYSDLLHVDIIADDHVHRQAIRAAILPIHLPGAETEKGFRIFGYAQPGQFVDFISVATPTP